MPRLYREARIAQLESKRVIALAQEWVEHPAAGLLIVGPTGRGKTYLACALVAAFCGRHIPCLFMPATELYRRIRCAMRDLQDDVLVGDLATVDVFALDDLGAGSLSDFERRTTLEVVESRLSSMRPTIVTSNWSLTEISERIDDRLASRLASYPQVVMEGKDWRTGSKKGVERLS